MRDVRLSRSIALVLVGLTAAACEKQPASIKVKGPRDALESVKMNPTFPPFEKKGDTIKLRASAFDESGAFMGAANVKWDSSDRSTATVDQAGLVTILSSGKVDITATSVGYEKELTASLPLQAVITDKLRIVPPEGLQKMEVHLGEVLQFKAEVLDDRGAVIPDAKVRWRSSSFAVTVTDGGEVEGRAIGNAQLVAESGPATARLEVEVLDWPKGKAPRE